ncbi:hypothetical protein MG290_10830 [Flavobacterium sp. CBA20B-1]|uniref:hypothetical protein n=1 Tax=unclassified Flavobacterium TaxID=196869 RepID=UPI00222591F7|nr:MULTISPECIES: hypothetical protein [unclassified Flavobacterium]WCM41442.1 hypothetical protein MG290_10830 [Flavobacterium sp. CBA20B-1]
MKKDELKKKLKTQNKQLKKQKSIIKSYNKLLGEYEDLAKRMKKSIKRFESLLEDIEVEEELTDEEIDQIMNQFNELGEDDLDMDLDNSEDTQEK